MQETVRNLSSFELYLEGIKVPFSSISINEVEGGLPSANMSFPLDSGALKVLPGTIVQVFGPSSNGTTEKLVLLFEGDIQSKSYRKTPVGRDVTIKCQSLLAGLFKTSVYSPTSLVSDRYINKTASAKAYIIKPENLNTESSNYKLNVLKKTEEVLDITVDDVNSIKLDIFKIWGLLWQAINNDDNVKTGNFIKLTHTLSTYFEVFDVLYGLNAQSFRISESIFAFPNPEKINANKLDLMKKMMGTPNMSIIESPPIGLSSIISQFYNLLFYRMLYPAAFTNSYSFYTTNASQVPTRMYLLPDLDNSPPALCNVFFPNQLDSLNLDINYQSIPTRLTGTSTTPLGKYEGVAGPLTTYLPHTVVPSNTPIFKDELHGVDSGFTEEELYRGVRSELFQINGDLIFTLIGQEASPAFTEDSPFLTALHDFSVHEFSRKKSMGKSCSLQSEWNPHRMIGVPALIFDIGAPSVTGVIHSIITSITPKSIFSKINLRNARVLYDEELDGPFSSTSTSINTFNKFIINNFTSDPYLPINNRLYNEDLYNFDKIGMDTYSYLLFGKGSKRGKFLDLSKAGAPASPPFVNNPPFVNYNANLESMKTTSRVDHSILHFLRDYSTPDNLLKSNELIKEDDSLSVTYTKYMYLAIQKIKSLYIQARHSKTNLQKFTDKITWRDLIDKNSYLTYLNVSNTGNKKDYKDPATLLDKANNLRGLLMVKSEEEVSTKFSQSKSTKEWVEAELRKTTSDMFLPYNITRYAQVIEAFKTTLKSEVV